LVSQNAAVVGFANGVIRLMQVCRDQIRLIKALKVHKDSIRHLRFSLSKSILVVISESGDIFLLSYNEKTFELEPYCFFETGFEINSLHISAFEDKLLLGC
jgi:cilia- and flagella-associated protein 44